MFFFKKHNLEATIAEKKKDFTAILDITNDWISDKPILEKFELIDYVMQSIRTAICANERFNSIRVRYREPLHRPFPISYRTSDGIPVLVDEEDVVTLELASTSIYVRPWNYQRAAASILHLSKEEFHSDANHKAVFYKDLNLCYIYSGNHSINAGEYFQKGTIKAYCSKIEQLYPHCITDGAFWYSSYNHQVMCDTQSAEIAALYMLGRTKFEIKEQEAIRTGQCDCVQKKGASYESK